MRILVIEDEVKTAEYVRQGLTESGYIVDCVHTGYDGLFLAKQHMYELIILDINLPEMDGWQVRLNSTHKCNAHPCMHFVRRLPAQALARA